MVFGFGTTKHFEADQIPRLDGKVAIVTGSNSGIGKETAAELALHGAHVVLACRNEERASEAAEQIRARIDAADGDDGRAKGSVSTGKLDLSDLKSVKAFAGEFLATHDRLDILVLNAARIIPTFSTATSPVHELTFVTNHLGHFYLTSLLLPTVVRSGEDNGEGARIVVVAADVMEWMDWMPFGGHRKESVCKLEEIDDQKQYASFRAYSRTKVHNVLFCRRLAALIERAYDGEANVYVNALHPGGVTSEIGLPSRHANGDTEPGVLEHLIKWALVTFEGWIHVSVERGALTSLYVATSGEIKEKGYRGRTFIPYGVVSEPASVCKDEETMRELWALSKRLVGEAMGAEEGDKVFAELEAK